MLLHLEQLSTAINQILEQINFKFILNSLRGCGVNIDPWMTYDEGSRLIDAHINSIHKNLFKMFLYGDTIKIDSWNLDKSLLDFCIKSNFIVQEKDSIHTNNYCLTMYDNIVVVVELHPSFPNCKKKYSDVYIGYDSFVLSRYLEIKENSTVLDLCSGSGIQGILSARRAKEVVSIEINPNAIPIIKLNALLNGYENKIKVINSDLYPKNLNQKFDYICVNPPFIPMIENTTYPICGDGGPDGLSIIKRIISELPHYLNPDGCFIMYAQLLGDEYGNLLLEKYLHDLPFSKTWDCLYKYDKRTCVENQIIQTKQIATLIDNNFNKNYSDEMLKIYQSLNAKFLYLVMCKYKLNGSGNIIKIDFTNNWTLSNKAVVSDVVIDKDINAYIISDKQNNLLGYFDKEAIDLINGFQKGYDLQQIISSLVENSNASLKETYKSALIENSLEVCKKLEDMGIIKKQ